MWKTTNVWVWCVLTHLLYIRATSDASRNSLKVLIYETAASASYIFSVYRLWPTFDVCCSHFQFDRYTPPFFCCCLVFKLNFLVQLYIEDGEQRNAACS